MRARVDRRSGTAAAGLAAVACAVGFACGRAATAPAPRVPLAPAGSARDDGSGFLARVSGGAPLGDDARSAGGRTYGGVAYGGGTYGGVAYGGRTYGGSIYAGYQFRARAQPVVAPISPYSGRYTVAPSLADAGAVHGVVLWPHPPEPLARLAPAARAGRACAGGAANPSLVRTSDGRVAGALVFIEDITRGRALGGRSVGYTQRVLQLGGALEWRACELRPHLQISAPIGAVLTVTAVDEAVALRSVRWDGAAREAHFDVALGAPGATRDLQLSRAGLIEVKAAPAGAAAAWIVVAQHPYYGLTDEDGRFALDEVPPGTYTLVAWHEPVIVGVDARGEPIVTAAAETRRRVVVRARQEQDVTLKLPPVR